MSKIIMGLSGAVTQGVVDQDLTVTTQPQQRGNHLRVAMLKALTFLPLSQLGKHFNNKI